MGSKSNPTFAEALLATMMTQRFATNWDTAVSASQRLINTAPPEIRCALGVDKQPAVEPRELALEKQLAAAVACAERAEAALERITRTRVDTVCPYCNEHLCSHGISETEREIVTSHAKVCPKHPNRDVERERDALRAELDKAKADVMAANLRARTAQDERDALKAKLATAEKRAEEYGNDFAKVFAERDGLAAKLDAARKALDAKETT